MRQAGIVTCALLLGCTGGRSGSGGPPTALPEVALRSPSELGDDFLYRQSISATFQGREVSFDAALQKQGDKLTLLGLTPFGTRAFLLEQNGTVLRFENYVDRELPFPPSYIIHDVARTFFVNVRAADDGPHTFHRGEETYADEWLEGRLQKREISLPNAVRQPAVIIDYGEGLSATQPPPLIRFEHRAFGYALEIKTTATQLLP